MTKAPNKSSAVRQQRAAAVQEGDNAQTALYRQLNFYCSPPWTARAGAELVKRLDPQATTVWEPACGQGHMAEPLAEYFSTVYASDIHAHGYGKVHDFLLGDEMPWPGEERPSWVFTNPPFNRAEAFLEKGLKIATRGVALLCRISFLEGEERYRTLYVGDNSLTVFAPFIERAPMFLGRWDPEGSSPATYGWFLFRKFHCHIAPAPMVWPIPPGTKARLHRKEDVRRFGMTVDAPLFRDLA